MKTRKAIKKLTHAETLLAEVVENFGGIGKDVLDTINSAKNGVEQARLTVESARDVEPEQTRVTVPGKGVRSATARHEAKTKTA